MAAIRLLLKLLTTLICILFIAAVLYFPVVNLVAYAGHATRMFTLNQRLSPNDVILPSFVIAIVYAAIEMIRRRIGSGLSHRDDHAPSADHEHAET